MEITKTDTTRNLHLSPAEHLGRERFGFGLICFSYFFLSQETWVDGAYQVRSVAFFSGIFRVEYLQNIPSVKLCTID